LFDSERSETSNRTPFPTRRSSDLSGNAINQQKATHLQNQPNVEVVSFPSESVHLKDVLTDLGRRNVMTLLVEGGATVHASFVETKAFDEIVVYMAPKVIGGKEA